MIKKSIETKGHGSIRKTKAYGAVAVLSLFGALAVANGQEVSANEIPTTGEGVTTEASDTSLATQAASVETPSTPVAEAVVETPVAEPVVETPVAEVAAEPVVEVAQEAPVTEPAVETVVEAAPVVAENVVAETPVDEVVSETVAEGTEVVTNADTAVTVETNELSTAITEAQAAGVTVRQGETVNLGTATTEQEVAALQAEAESKQAEQAQVIQDKTAKYLDELAQAQANTSKDGYLSETVVQSLIYKSEPTATISSITGAEKYLSQKVFDNASSSKEKFSSSSYGSSDRYDNYNGGNVFLLKNGQTAQVIYQGLQNSTFNGQKVTKAIIDYTLLSSSTGEAVVQVYSDPTGTVTFGDGDGGGIGSGVGEELKFNLQLFTEDGNIVTYSKENSAIFGNFSLNRHDGLAGGKGYYEYVRDLGDNSHFVTIAGSPVKVTNGSAYASLSIDEIAPYRAHDTDPNFRYYGGIAAVVDSGNSFSGVIGSSTGTMNHWHTISTELYTAEPITKPTAEYNLYSYDVAIPDPVGDVVVRYQSTDGFTIKDQVIDTSETTVGTTYDTTDHKPNVISFDGNEYVYVTVSGNETGQVVEGRTTITYIYSLVKKGDVIIDYKNTKGAIIKDRVVDTPLIAVGTPYETYDNKPAEIVKDGKTYRYQSVSGVEKGSVVEGTTVVTYIYDEVLGTVVVNYRDEDGNVIKDPVVDTPESSIGTDYNTTDNKPNKITTNSGKTYSYKTVEGNEAGKVVEGETKVTYIYSEVFGDVVVDYQDKNGNTISPREVDTPSTSTGTNYDTTDNKPVTIVTPAGKTYRIDTTATKGNETGKVVEGTTQVIYIYDEVLGNVVIDYKDTEGNTLKVRVTDTPDSSTGTAYDTTDNKPKEIEANGTVYRIKPELTVGQETGKVVEGTTLVTYVYDVVKGTVTVNYHDEDGNPIKPPVTDTPSSPVKTPYDTTDNKPKEIKTEDGKSYRIIPNKTIGKETGEVVEGDTPVTYVYKEIKGDVIVDYKDKNGNTINPRVTDTPETSTGTPYDTTDHKIVTIVTPEGKTFRIDQKATQGSESGKVVEGTTQVVYIYDEILGSVIVHYEDEDGNTIKSDVVDTPDSSTNTPYDTGDNKPKTIVTETGRTYELVPGLTRGVEVGRVVEGKTHVTYVYKELFGNVLVNYVDEEGNIIKAQVEDMPQTSTGVAYSTLDNKPNAIKSGDTIYNIIPGKTIGQETGKIVVGTTEVTYVYKVVEAEPVKVGTSDSGANVEGKVLLAGSTINYEVSIDNDQFKGIVGLTEEDLNTPLIVIEDFDDKTTPVTEAVRVVLASDKTKAQSGFTTTLYTSLAEAPKVIQDYIAANNISVNGEFSATVSDDAVAYNTNYVLTGTNLTLIFPAKINEDVKDASEIKNTAYQLDFSGAHVTNVVTNTTPEIDPQKDVTFTIEDGMADKNSLDGKEVAIGDVINFELKSSYYPANRVEPITELAFVDTWSDLVSYDGSYQFFATTDLLLKDGTTIVEGTDITKYVTQVINYEDRTVRYALDSDFLGAIALESPLQVAGYMQVTVEENGTVKNTFVEIVNGVENFSNTVTVEVPTPPVPEKPEEPAQPAQPTPETPVTPASVVPTLPNTGEETSSLAMAGMALLVGMGAAYGVSKRRRRSLK